MNMDTLSNVVFGDDDSLKEFLFENGLQHQLFRDTLASQGALAPAYPLIDLEIDNIDDWLQMHQVEHQFFASELGLSNPFNMLDADWRKEDDFYEWLSQHYLTHEQIAAALGVGDNG